MFIIKGIVHLGLREYSWVLAQPELWRDLIHAEPFCWIQEPALQLRWPPSVCSLITQSLPYGSHLVNANESSLGWWQSPLKSARIKVVSPWMQNSSLPFPHLFPPQNRDILASLPANFWNLKAVLFQYGLQPASTTAFEACAPLTLTFGQFLENAASKSIRRQTCWRQVEIWLVLPLEANFNVVMKSPC